MLYKLLTASLPRSMANCDTLSPGIGVVSHNGRLLVVSQDVTKRQIQLLVPQLALSFI